MIPAPGRTSTSASSISLVSGLTKMAAAASKRTFLYFAYGSNLLRERIHICNPSAVFKATAKLEVNYS